MKIGIGLGRGPDAEAAARQACRQALSGAPRPQLTLAFGGIKLDQAVLHAVLKEELGGDALLGASSYAEITPAGVSKDSVVVLAVELEGLGASFASAPLDPKPYQTGVALARAAGKPSGAGRPLALLFASLSDGYDNEALRALADTFGRLPVFGGMGCGDYDLGLDHPDFWKNYQYCGGELTQNAAGLALLELPRGVKVGFGLEHGWQPVGPAVRVTKASGNKIFAVDGVPVLDYYRQFVGGESQADFFKLLIQRYGFSLMTEGRSRLKLPSAIDPAEGSICYIPAEELEGRRVQLIQANRRDLLEGARRAAEAAKAALGGAPPSLVLMVSCCTRNAILHSRMDTEVEVVRSVFGADVPIFGFYSGGEVSPMLPRYDDVVAKGGALAGSFYHTTTVALLALAAPGKTEVVAPLPAAAAADDAASLRRQLSESERILDSAETFLSNLSRKSYEDGEKLRKQSEVLHRYTPHGVWRQVGASAAKGKYELADSDFEGCFMFLDVKGFTTFSEDNEPEDVVKALNAIFGPATEIIYECGGDVDKYIGDCIFAAFPGPDEALRAGRRLMLLLKELKKSGTPFSLRIGASVGHAVRANLGSRDRREYTYIGDAVNLAQRLEANCTPGKMLISKDLYEMAATPFEEVVEKELLVKGKRRPVKCYECSV